jgi:hypothetical protein
VAALRIANRQVSTVFDLLGTKENDLTYSLGWALSRAPRLLAALVRDVLGHEVSVAGAEVHLQQHGADAGFTDMELVSDRFHIIVEAKRGWILPRTAQLERYERRLAQAKGETCLVTLSDYSREFAARRALAVRGGTRVTHLSWGDVHSLAGCRVRAVNERRVLSELRQYLEGVIRMQDQRSNEVYVVSLGTAPTSWCLVAPTQLVEQKRVYFMPAGERGFPKEPPNYMGFRYHGRLQSIHHVEGWSVPESLHEAVPEARDQNDPHFLLRLGPPIVPQHEVRSGPIRASRRWAALDLLLTASSIPEAVEETKRRLGAAER